MTEGKEYDSGLFDRAEEARVIAENPGLAAGKELVKMAIEDAIGEFDDAQDIMESMRNRPVYDVIFFKAEPYLKTPTGAPERVSVYINRLEKSLISLSKKLKEAEETSVRQYLQLEEFRVKEINNAKPVTKRKRKVK